MSEKGQANLRTTSPQEEPIRLKGMIGKATTNAEVHLNRSPSGGDPAQREKQHRQPIA